MVSSKKYCNLRANSLLESVIALTIISICLYFAIMIFAAVFTPRTSSKFYITQNKVNTFFFLSQLKKDSLDYENEEENLIIEEEKTNTFLTKITVKFKDSAQSKFDATFYIQNDEE